MIQSQNVSRQVLGTKVGQTDSREQARPNIRSDSRRAVYFRLGFPCWVDTVQPLVKSSSIEET